MSVARPRFAHRLALAGLALSLLATASTPFLASHDALAKPRKANHGVSQERKGKGKRPKTVTRSFSQEDGIVIRTGELPGGVPSSPYPSSLKVKGFKRGTIVDLDLTLHGFQHETPPDVDILLVKDGVAVQVMGDAGDITADDVAFLTLDDEADDPLPFFERLSAGRFQPTDHDQGGTDDDTFPPPATAPAPGNDSRLSAFDGLDPNGNWRLFVVDARNEDAGGSIDGWELTMQVKEKGKKKRR